jgi:hypothetical protein
MDKLEHKENYIQVAEVIDKINEMVEWSKEVEKRISELLELEQLNNELFKRLKP